MKLAIELGAKEPSEHQGRWKQQQTTGHHIVCDVFSPDHHWFSAFSAKSFNRLEFNSPGPRVSFPGFLHVLVFLVFIFFVAHAGQLCLGSRGPQFKRTESPHSKPLRSKKEFGGILENYTFHLELSYRTTVIKSSNHLRPHLKASLGGEGKIHKAKFF